MARENFPLVKPTTEASEVYSVKPKARKVMIVGSEISDDLETYLAREGWAAIWVGDGTAAVSRVRREAFDMAVLISTGKDMDVTETLFNLRDIRESMTVVVVNQANDPLNRPWMKPFSRPDAMVRVVRGLDGLVKLISNTVTAERNMSLL
jgi:hypothetical protein